MIENNRVFRDFVLEAVSNDYESIDQILEQVVSWSNNQGLIPTHEDIVGILENTIKEGYVQAYLLSAEEPRIQVVEFSPDRLDRLWFYVTPKGKEIVAQL